MLKVPSILLWSIGFLSKDMQSINFEVFVLTVIVALAIISFTNWYMIFTRSVNSFNAVVLSRFFCALVLSIPCIVFFDSTYFDISNEQLPTTMTLCVILSFLGWLTNKTRRHTPTDKKLHGYLYSTTPNISFLIFETIEWLVYLLPYEFLLRGLLLPYSLQRWDYITAFTVNTLIYTASHWQQGKREIGGAFLMGWITCYVTYLTGNFWTAFVVHAAIALSNSYITVDRNRMST